jgi:hypothetical protein
MKPVKRSQLKGVKEVPNANDLLNTNHAVQDFIEDCESSSLVKGFIECCDSKSDMSMLPPSDDQFASIESAIFTNNIKPFNIKTTLSHIRSSNPTVIEFLNLSNNVIVDDDILEVVTLIALYNQISKFILLLC